MTGGLGEDTRAMIHPTAFGVGCGIIEPRESGMGNRACAHGAGLERHPKVTTIESELPQSLRRRTNGENFRMGCGVISRAHGVAGGRNFHPIAHDNRANWHFPGIGSSLR
jgi:hypothetical protein